MTPEPSFLYSSRSYWYPQAPVTDYATARIRITVPPALECVASGELEAGFPVPAGRQGPGAAAARSTSFTATQPLRYLAFVVSRFTRVGDRDDRLPGSTGERPRRCRRQAPYRSLNLVGRSQSAAGRSAAASSPTARADIAQFYESLLGDIPYPSFTLALVESDLPGRPQPGVLRRAQPAAADLAARLAQRSGRVRATFPSSSSRTNSRTSGGARRSAGGTTTSSGSARASRSTSRRSTRSTQRGDEAFAGVLRQMRRWGMRRSPTRGRSTSAIASATSAATAASSARSSTTRARWCCTCCAGWSATRRSSAGSGASTPSRGSRRPAPTTSARAMEAEAGRSLDRFFERWIYGSTLPTAEVQRTRVDGARRSSLHVRAARRGLRRAGDRHAQLRRPARRSTSSCRSPIGRRSTKRVPLAGHACAASSVNKDGAADRSAETRAKTLRRKLAYDRVLWKPSR